MNYLHSQPKLNSSQGYIIDLDTIEEAGAWREPSGYFPAMYVTIEGTSKTDPGLELYTKNCSCKSTLSTENSWQLLFT